MPAAHAVLALTLSAVTAAPVARAAPVADDEATESAVRLLRFAVTPGPRWTPAGVLALRQLEHPSLRPLYFQLVQAEMPWLQAHGVLGVAELSDERRLDPWLLEQVEPSAQDIILTEAIDAGLADDATMDAVLQWSGLEPLPRLLLWAERLHDRDVPSRDSIEALLEAAGPEVRDRRIEALAACLLAERGAPARLNELRAGLAQTPDDDQTIGLLRWSLEAIRQYRLTASLPLAELALEAHPEKLDLLSSALLALLHLDPQRGLERWTWARASVPRTATLGGRVRMAMLLLDSAATLPPDAFDAVEPDLDVVAAIARAGRSISAGADPTPALAALLDLQHGPSTDWILGRLERMPEERARALPLHLLDTLDTAPTAERLASTVGAAAVLARLDLPAVLSRLAAAEDDGLVQQVLLLGLLEVNDPRIHAAVHRLPRGTPGKADSLALLLLARNADASLDDAQLRRLGLIAMGGGRVSEPLRVQAAWLYLFHAGRTEAALARIFSNA